MDNNELIKNIILNQKDFDKLPRNEKGECIYVGNLIISNNKIKKLPDNLNISGNFEYISIVTLTRNSDTDTDSYTINHEFNEIFLYKHDIDLINKLNTIDDTIINILSIGTSTTITSDFYYKVLLQKNYPANLGKKI